MKHKNKAMRDFTIYRPLDIVHHRVGDKFKVFPSYDFICPIVDSIEGITHVFRSDEFNERDDQYKYILKTLGMRIPVLYHYGKLGIKGTVMSKRKLNKAIEDKIYSGYDDPRLYTIKGMKSSGLHLEGLEKFMNMTGYPLSGVELEPDNLWSINRKVIDKYAGQYVVLNKSDVKVINISNIEDKSTITKEIPKYNRYPQLGNKTLFYTPNISMIVSDLMDLKDNEEFTLIDYGNMIYKDSATLLISPNKDIKSTTKKIRWLPVSDNNVIVKIKECVHNNVIEYIGEPAIGLMKIGDIARFKNMNYYILSNISENIYSFIEIK